MSLITLSRAQVGMGDQGSVRLGSGHGRVGHISLPGVCLCVCVCVLVFTVCQLQCLGSLPHLAPYYELILSIVSILTL